MAAFLSPRGSRVFRHLQTRVLLKATLHACNYIFFLRHVMEWVGASVIAPRPHTPIEFEIAAHPGVRAGYFHEGQFYIAGDPAAYPRKLIKRWRYLAEEPAPTDVAYGGG
jgi:hypothetical protein